MNDSQVATIVAGSFSPFERTFRWVQVTTKLCGLCQSLPSFTSNHDAYWLFEQLSMDFSLVYRIISI
jgi:hypothetical protein